MLDGTQEPAPAPMFSDPLAGLLTGYDDASPGGAFAAGRGFDREDARQSSWHAGAVSPEVTAEMRRSVDAILNDAPTQHKPPPRVRTAYPTNAPAQHAPGMLPTNPKQTNPVAGIGRRLPRSLNEAMAYGQQAAPLMPGTGRQGRQQTRQARRAQAGQPGQAAPSGPGVGVVVTLIAVVVVIIVVFVVVRSFIESIAGLVN
jgi:hypothetical protein